MAHARHEARFRVSLKETSLMGLSLHGFWPDCGTAEAAPFENEFKLIHDAGARGSWGLRDAGRNYPRMSRRTRTRQKIRAEAAKTRVAVNPVERIVVRAS
jgi:hypothetical protein